MSEHAAYVAALRAIADLYESHPEIPVPSFECITNYSVNTKKDAMAVARALGSCRKEYADTLLTIVKKFGPIEARFVFTRSQVCTRKVIGTETIPEQFIPAHTEPARTKEIVEWECEPILAPTADGTMADVPETEPAL